MTCPPLLRLIALPLVCGAGLAQGASGPTPVKQIESAPVAARDHHLFVGVDLFMTTKDGLEPVRRIDTDHGEAIVATPAGGTARLPRSAGFGWRMAPKVAPLAIAISDLKTRRIYSPATDPAREWATKQATLMEYFAHRADAADKDLRTLDQRIEFAAHDSTDNRSPSEITAQTYEEINSVSTAIDQVSRNDVLKQPTGDSETGAFDGLNLTFEVSAPQPVSDAYVVVLSRIRRPDGELSDVNYSHDIGAVGPTPRKVAFAQFGLPPGFEHVSSELHLFTHGQELATSLSERHLPLSGDEARQFLLMSHLAAHRGEDAPAEVAWSLAPASLRNARDARLFNYPAKVEIDAQGHFVAIDAPGQVVPDQVRAILASLTYLPALQAGEAVAGSLTVNLADYFCE